MQKTLRNCSACLLLMILFGESPANGENRLTRLRLSRNSPKKQFPAPHPDQRKKTREKRLEKKNWHFIRCLIPCFLLLFLLFPISSHAALVLDFGTGTAGNGDRPEEGGGYEGMHVD